MTHVDPLSPTIFNVVVYAVVLHWKSLAAERAGGDSRNNNTAKPAGRMIRESDKRQRRTEEGHTRLKVKEYFFHAEGGMVASTDPGWLHSALNMPTLLFDQLGLKKFKKTVGMVCHPCRKARVRSGKAYIWRMTRIGRIYKEQHWERVNFPN